MSNKIMGKTIDALSRSLDLRSKKHNLISANIANAETPGYKAKRIDFEDSLAKALSLTDAPMARTNSKHMRAGGEVGQVKPEIYNNPNNVVREDGNTVDRDAEMVALAENQMLYNSSIESLRRKLALIKYAISEGGR